MNPYNTYDESRLTEAKSGLGVPKILNKSKIFKKI